ncbi:MAG: DUF58 domain-containing protein [Chloroflexi bacterium]|nr:DUF58 domain-containing protein [Chloroflexota bacterium]
MPFRDAWLAVGTLLILVGFGAGEPTITAVGFVVVLVGGMSRLWSRHLFDRVTLRRTLGEKRAFIDEPIEFTVELENRKLLPLPWYQWRLALADPIHVADEHLGSAAVPGQSWLVRRGSMGWYERRKWTFEAHATERGYHQVGPATIRSADLFGVFPRLHEDGEWTHLTVFPKVFPLEDLGLPAVRPFGERSGGNRVFEDPLRVAGLREYRPGDPLKRIDWKATARSGELVSRVYDPSATHQLYVVLNIDTMAHSWEGYLKDELEKLVSVAASISVWAAGQRYGVGLLANGSFPNADRPIKLAPSRARDQLTRVLEALAVIQPLTLGDLAGALERESGRLPAGSTIVAVAALAPEPLAAVLARLHSEGHRVYVIATTDKVAPAIPRGIAVYEIGGAAAWAAAPA